MKTDKTNAERLEYVIKAKASYRADARAKTWEEKIESIARMRRGAAEQKCLTHHAVATDKFERS